MTIFNIQIPSYFTIEAETKEDALQQVKDMIENDIEILAFDVEEIEE